MSSNKPYFQTRYSCRKCGRKHHVSLYERGERQQKVVRGTLPEKKDNQAINYYVSAQDSVLLQPAQAYVGFREQATGIRARVILDSGSQKSFIKGSVRDQLKLPTITKEPLVIKTFGNKEIDRTETRDQVQFTVGDIGGFSKSRMEPTLYPRFLHLISSQEIDRAKRCFTHLEEIDLADGNHGSEEMEIILLIGADYMWPFSLERQEGESWKMIQWRVNLV